LLLFFLSPFYHFNRVFADSLGVVHFCLSERNSLSRNPIARFAIELDNGQQQPPSKNHQGSYSFPCCYPNFNFSDRFVWLLRKRKKLEIRSWVFCFLPCGLPNCSLLLKFSCDEQEIFFQASLVLKIGDSATLLLLIFVRNELRFWVFQIFVFLILIFVNVLNTFFLFFFYLNRKRSVCSVSQVTCYSNFAFVDLYGNFVLSWFLVVYKLALSWIDCICPLFNLCLVSWFYGFLISSQVIKVRVWTCHQIKNKKNSVF